jgi:hypothetical protein
MVVRWRVALVGSRGAVAWFQEVDERERESVGQVGPLGLESYWIGRA